MKGIGIVLLAWAGVGCLTPSAIECADGRVCASQYVCDIKNHLCVTPEQLDTCGTLEEGAECPIAGETSGFCSMGVCIPSVCGDSMIRGSERCDGTNLDGKTGCKDLGYYVDGPIECTADCVFDTKDCGGGRCGDGIVQAQEFCEDGEVPPATSCLDFGFDTGRIGCSSACAPSYDACAKFNFFSVVSGTTQRLGSVWGSSPDNVYAAGIGTIVHYDGSTWTAMDPNTSEALVSIKGSAPDNVWAVGIPTVVTRFDGAAWSATTIPGAVDYLLDVWTSGPNNVYVVGASPDDTGRIYHWDGASWTTTNTPKGVQGIWGISNNDIYAVGDNGLVMHWDGTSWSPSQAGTQQLADVWASGPNDVWAVGSQIVHKDASGWSVVSQPVPTDYVYSITGVGNRVMIAIQDGVLIGDASGFVHVPGVRLDGLWAFTDDDVWGVTAGGTRHFTGTAWLDDGNPVAKPFTSVSGASSTYTAALTTSTGPEVVVWDGLQWTSIGSSGGGSSALWVAGVDDIFVSSGFGSIYRWNRDTSSSDPTWHTVHTGPGAYAAITGRNANDVWAVGDNGAVNHWDGSNWTQSTVPDAPNLVAVWAPTTTAVFAAGGNFLSGGIYQLNGSTWTQTYVGTNVIRSLWGTAATDMYAAGSEGLLHWDGVSWKVVDAGLVASLTAVSGTGPNDIFAAGANGSLTHFDGTQWSAVRTPTQLQIDSVYATPNRLFVGGERTFVLYRKP